MDVYQTIVKMFEEIGVDHVFGGSGAFNLFSGLAVAYSDSIPMLAISGYPSRYTRAKSRLRRQQ